METGFLILCQVFSNDKKLLISRFNSLIAPEPLLSREEVQIQVHISQLQDRLCSIELLSFKETKKNDLKITSLT